MALMKSKRKLIVIIVVTVLLVLAIVGGVMFFMLGTEEPEEGEEEVEVEEIETKVEIPDTEALIYLKLKPFTSTVGKEPRYVKISMQLKFGSEPPKAFLSNRLAEVKDAVIAVLQNTDTKDIQQKGWLGRLKERIILRLNTLFPEEKEWVESKPIRKVLFHEFLVQ